MARKLPPPGKGGKREGSGRKPEWLQNECKRIVDVNGLLDFLGDVASGKPVKSTLGIKDENGYVKEMSGLQVSADIKDRLKAVEMLMDRGWGKPPQAVEVGGKDGGPIAVAVVRYEA